MKQGLLILTLLFLLVAILALSWSYVPYAPYDPEGFAGLTQEDAVYDRANPLAVGTTPQRNPAAPIGLSDASASSLRRLMDAAMGGDVSPRIDTADSYLGLAKFCKETAAATGGSSPFSNPAFAENCGVCMSSGTLVLQDASGKPTKFDGATGVLVYKADKDAAIANQETYNYSFPHVIPSLNAATCMGASTGTDAKPVLAIRESDYSGFKKRAFCLANPNHTGNECGKCMSPELNTYVASSGTTHPFTLHLWGIGLATVLVRGSAIPADGAKPGPVSLSMTKGQHFSLGTVAEGSSIEIAVTGSATDALQVYGLLMSKNSVNKDYKLAIDRFIELDYVSSNPPRRGTPSYFTEVQRTLIPLKASQSSLSMRLVGTLPITMVDSSQLAAYDCPTSPILTLPASADILLDGPCNKPKGQGPGKYSKECLQDIFTNAGCSVEGTWYNNLVPIMGSMKMGEILSVLKQIVPQAKTNVYYAKACLGKDISTPCDAYVDRNTIPSKECLIYTYKNQSEGGLLGRSYKGIATNYTSLENRKIQFCQPEGRLNPEMPDGESRLRDVASNGYKGMKGLAAVRAYLTDIFTKATSNLDPRKMDSEGGRADSWADCFGIRIADPPLGSVKLLSNNKVIPDFVDSCVPFPKTFVPRRNQFLGTTTMTGDYTISFTITPRQIIPDWGNIIRFQSAPGNKGDCCAFGLRSPAIWFILGQLGFHVRIGDATDGNWGINTNPIPLGQPSTFSLVCKGPLVTVTVNSQTYSARQPTRRYSGPMVLYGGDPWYNPAQATVTDFCYTIG